MEIFEFDQKLYDEAPKEGGRQKNPRKHLHL